MYASVYYNFEAYLKQLISFIKSSGSCLENREYGRSDPSRWPRGTLDPQKLAITSPTSGGRSVGIIRSRTQNMEFYIIYKCDHLRKELMWRPRYVPTRIAPLSSS
jgi:hypothetical protein